MANAKPLPLAWLHAEDELPKALVIEPARPSRTATAPVPPAAGQFAFAALVRTRRTRHYRSRGHLGRGALARCGCCRAICGFAVTRETGGRWTHADRLSSRIVPLSALGLPSDRPFGEFRAMHQLAEEPAAAQRHASTPRAIVCVTCTGRPRDAAVCRPRPGRAAARAIDR